MRFRSQVPAGLDIETPQDEKQDPQAVIGINLMRLFWKAQMF